MLGIELERIFISIIWFFTKLSWKYRLSYSSQGRWQMTPNTLFFSLSRCLKCTAKKWQRNWYAKIRILLPITYNFCITKVFRIAASHGIQSTHTFGCGLHMKSFVVSRSDKNLLHSSAIGLIHLKGQCHEMFDPVFVWRNIYPGPLWKQTVSWLFEMCKFRKK